MTEKARQDFATYCDAAGNPVAETYFARFQLADGRDMVGAFTTWQEREEMLEAAADKGMVAEGVRHHAAYQFARGGGSLWLHSAPGEWVPLTLIKHTGNVLRAV